MAVFMAIHCSSGALIPLLALWFSLISSFGTFTRLFETRHIILSNVGTNVRFYVVTWLKDSRESNRHHPDHTKRSLVPILLNRSHINRLDGVRDGRAGRRWSVVETHKISVSLHNTNYKNLSIKSQFNN